MMKKLGSAWGGWLIETSLIRDNSVVVSAGLAHDITFDVALMEMNDTIKVIGIDPTPSSKQSVDNLPANLKERFIYVDKALHGTQGQVSLGGDANSILQPLNATLYQALSLNEVMDGVDVCLLKMDIEGSEYSVFRHLDKLNADQVCVEWHHWLGSGYTVNDTLNCIDRIVQFGYIEVARSTNLPERIIQESLFVRRDLVRSVNFA